MSATVRLHPIRTGEMLAPPLLLVRAPGYFGTPKALGIGVSKSQYVWIPVPAFLIEHPTHGAFVIDTGLPELAATDFKAAIGPTGARLYELRMTPEEGLGPALRARGVDPEQVSQVVMTHLHIDHAAGMCDLPNATFAASEAEWRIADANPITRQLGGYHRPHYDGRKRRVLNPERGTAWGAFERTLDLFGDGSVRVLSTPGHTAGHQSFAVETDSGPVILTGDLAYTRAGVYGDAEPGMRAKPRLLRQSLDQLRRHVREHPDTLVIPGHDAEAWAALKPVY